MEIFNYKSRTNEFSHKSIARKDPMNEGNFLIPASATVKPLPNLAKNEAAVFNAKLNDWEIKPDFREEVYYLKSDGSRVDFLLGESPDTKMQTSFPTAIQVEIDRADLIATRKRTRDDALNALTYDFGDGRIIQTRPKDEPNIRLAIEAMKKYGINSRMWLMIDDIKYETTLSELEASYDSGVISGIEIWDNYNTYEKAKLK